MSKSTHKWNQQEARDRAVNGNSLSNYPAIIQGFMEMGIAESEIKPRVNVLTFAVWKTFGRSVRRGQHGVRIATTVPYEFVDKATGELIKKSRPLFTTVFHISQTEAIADRQNAKAA
jgi:hypothetical protein